MVFVHELLHAIESYFFFFFVVFKPGQIAVSLDRKSDLAQSVGKMPR